MRFSIAFASATLLAHLALGAPATQPNMAIESGQFMPQGAIDLKDSFETFNWKKTEEGSEVDRTFSFELTQPADLQITDFLQNGDSYEVLDNGNILASTSNVASSQEAFAATPEQALEDERFSRANIPLAAGKHDIVINVQSSQSENGSGAIRLVQKVQRLYNEELGDEDNSWENEGDDEHTSDNSDEGEYENDNDNDNDDEDEEGDDEEGDDEEEDGDDEDKQATKYMYVYFTTTATQHEEAIENGHGRPLLLVDEPLTTIASTSYITMTSTKFGMLSLPFLTIH
ncbi:hypothetical protein BY458DRAFT_578903 [Sporodiniella umbellata]|nr:hypothetical protein BY458DRAFT_578903 [Sporodiniella umbellata]